MKLIRTFTFEKEDINFIDKIYNSKELINEKLNIRIKYKSDVLFYSLKSLRNLMGENDIDVNDSKH